MLSPTTEARTTSIHLDAAKYASSMQRLTIPQ